MGLGTGECLDVYVTNRSVVEKVPFEGPQETFSPTLLERSDEEEIDDHHTRDDYTRRVAGTR